jgi:hypothetical protein
MHMHACAHTHTHTHTPMLLPGVWQKHHYIFGQRFFSPNLTGWSPYCTWITLSDLLYVPKMLDAVFHFFTGKVSFIYRLDLAHVFHITILCYASYVHLWYRAFSSCTDLLPKVFQTLNMYSRQSYDIFYISGFYFHQYQKFSTD